MQAHSERARQRGSSRGIAGVALCVCAASIALAPGAAARARALAQPQSAQGPSSPAQPAVGRALLAAKVLTVEWQGRQYLDRATVLVRDGRIEAVGPRAEVAIPAGYEVLDLGDDWLMPGLIDLHSHVGGTRGINDMVFQANPGLRVLPCVIPNNSGMQLAIAAGVTTVLFIPGSGTNMGGQGVLMKTGVPTWEGTIVREVGSLKVAQGDNPTRWGYRMGRLLMNYTLRKTFDKGLAYARRWLAHEGGFARRPERNPQLDVFRPLLAHAAQISTHTQYYQLVMMSIQMLAVDYPFEAFIDHGSFDSYENSERAAAAGVAAILGPRQVMWPRPPVFDTDGRVEGSAWGFQQAGHPQIGFNTDAPVIPQEELALQSGMGTRYGFDNHGLEAIRGLTIVPARTAGIADRLGSIEVGKQADLLVVTGDLSDQRKHVRRVFIDGVQVYDVTSERRRW